MARKSKEEPLLTFDEDSPLFAKKPAPKKKVVKKKIAIKKRQRKKVDLGDLFAKTSEPEPKKRGPKSHAELAEEDIIKENKRVAAKRATRSKKTKNPNKVYPEDETPEECKNILPAFKKFLKAKWKLLEGTDAEAATVSGYISGVMTVCSNNTKRQKEYDELYVLRAIAKRIYNERS